MANFEEVEEALEDFKTKQLELKAINDFFIPVTDLSKEKQFIL